MPANTTSSRNHPLSADVSELTALECGGLAAVRRLAAPAESAAGPSMLAQRSTLTGDAALADLALASSPLSTRTLS